jgi:ATP-binding cassette subfamily F protein 3
LAEYKNQQKQIEDIESFIERFRYKATKAVQVQSRIKQLDKIDRLEIEEVDNSALKISFPPAPKSGRVVVEAENISKSYDKLLVLNDIDFKIEQGEKIAFVGRNGEGKTTLARIIMQELKHEGTLKLGHNVKIGYFAQNQAQLLKEELTVFETIDEIAVGDVRTKIRDILGAFLFSGEDADKKVKVLSGGEKTRLAMIKLMLEPVNFLVLDEPTNHLDIRTKEILKNALINFNGTILVVSHDREFLDGLVTCVYEFRNKKAKQYLGGIYEFLERKKIESLRELEINNNSKKADKTYTSKSNATQELSFQEQKEIGRTISRLEKQVEKTELEIQSIEEESAKLDLILSSSVKLEDHSIFDKYENLKIKLKTAMEDWEKQHEELDNWKQKKNW